MVAAERLTIRITAMDSLNSCWRLGQTTSFSSSTVSARKPPDLVESAAAFEPSEVVVSSEMGLVTGMGPEVDNGAGRHFAKQTPYRMPSNPHRIEHQGIRAGLPSRTVTPLAPAKRSSSSSVESGFSNWRRNTRRSGRAPYSGSWP